MLCSVEPFEFVRHSEFGVQAENIPVSRRRPAVSGERRLHGKQFMKPNVANWPGIDSRPEGARGKGPLHDTSVTRRRSRHYPRNRN